MINSSYFFCTVLYLRICMHCFSKMHLNMNFNNSYINVIAVCINLFQCYSKTYFKLNFENSNIFYSISIRFNILRFNDIACINNCKL